MVVQTWLEGEAGMDECQLTGRGKMTFRGGPRRNWIHKAFVSPDLTVERRLTIEHLNSEFLYKLNMWSKISLIETI